MTSLDSFIDPKHWASVGSPLTSFLEFGDVFSISLMRVVCGGRRCGRNSRLRVIWDSGQRNIHDNDEYLGVDSLFCNVSVGLNERII